MVLTTTLVLLATISNNVLASPRPHQNNIEARQSAWNPYGPCLPCLRSSWVHGPECTTDRYVASILSLITNPPPSVTTSYTAPSFCSDYLRQTDWSSVYSTWTGPSTEVSWTLAEHLVTVTDWAHPTSTMYCALPSQDMTCGISNPNIVAPEDQQEDWTIEHLYNPEECHQVCLQHEGCKAYRVTEVPVPPTEPIAWNCEIFNLGLGVNGSNVISASKGDQWFDRNCPDHLPTACGVVKSPSSAIPSPPILTGASIPQTPPATYFTIAQPTTISQIMSPSPATITPGPALVPRVNLVRRDAPIPAFLSQIDTWYSWPYNTAACSCLISSGLPPVRLTTTFTVTQWNETMSTSTTFNDYFTVTVTPRLTTVYESIF